MALALAVIMLQNYCLADVRRAEDYLTRVSRFWWMSWTAKRVHHEARSLEEGAAEFTWWREKGESEQPAIVKFIEG